MNGAKTHVRMGEERDRGLALAIESAGSVSTLARKLGISQPAVSSWSRVPADRVVAVEAATGIDRQTLRPDLYRQNRDGGEVVVDPVDEGRIANYLLLARLLLEAPQADLLARLAGVKGDDSALGKALGDLARAAGESRADAIEREFFDLFIGVGRGELLPFGSYYQTGFLNEKPLERVRSDLRRMGVERQPDVFEPEDHIGQLFEVMAGLISGEFAGGAGEAERFFKRNIERWALRFFDDLAAAPSARFYKAVAGLGQVLMAVESEAFALPDMKVCAEAVM